MATRGTMMMVKLALCLPKEARLVTFRTNYLGTDGVHTLGAGGELALEVAGKALLFVAMGGQITVKRSAKLTKPAWGI
jgi:hypothetical protein